MEKKIAVVGTGANGSCLAADLVKANYQVALFDQWPEHVEAMRKNGLKVSMPSEEILVNPNAYHLCELCSLNEVFDYVFVMVKAYDTKWICHLMEPYLAEDGLMVGIQNGMTAEEIAEIVGFERTIACVVELSSEIFNPGFVQRNTPPERTWFGIGSLTDDMKHRVAEIEPILLEVGKVAITENIIAAKWMKLVINTMSLGPAAMLGLPLQEALKLEGVKEFALKVGTEALAVGQKRGYSIEPIFGLTKDDIKDTNRLLETLFDKLVADVGPAARDCVLQDHLKGRYSEVDLINGLVAHESKENGASGINNQAVTEITNRIRRGELEPDPANMNIAIELSS